MQAPALKQEQPGGKALDSAAPVQGHYGAMRKAGAEGCTYLHAQLMQVLTASTAQTLIPRDCSCELDRCCWVCNGGWGWSASHGGGSEI
jgi:hypothetical protein